jgi:hypothetical protein
MFVEYMLDFVIVRQSPIFLDDELKKKVLLM